jgi:hypothetical protein
MPRELPVTIAVFPSSGSGIDFLLLDNDELGSIPSHGRKEGYTHVMRRK